MVKFIDKYTIKYAENPIYIGDKVISNPTEETLKELGYKPLVETEYPEVEEYCIPVYEEKIDRIVQTWEVQYEETI